MNSQSQQPESTSSGSATVRLPPMGGWKWSTLSNWSGPLPNVPRRPPVYFHPHELGGPLRLCELLDANSLPIITQRIANGDAIPFGYVPQAHIESLSSITIWIMWKGYEHMRFRRQIDTRRCTITRAELAHAIAKVYDDFFTAVRGVAYKPHFVRYHSSPAVTPEAALPTFYNLMDRLSLLSLRHLRENEFYVDLEIWG